MHTRPAVRASILAILVAATLISIVPPSGARGSLGSGSAWAWTNRTEPQAPPAAAGTLMAYDSYADQFVFFGGWNGATLNQTWDYNPSNSTWVQLHPAVSPVSRADATFVYDSTTDRFLLFGGWTQRPGGAVHRLSDTWSFSLALDQWTELHTATGPSPRSDSAAAYDPAAGDLFLYGGFSGSVYLGDAWIFNSSSSTWSDLPQVGPTPGVRSDGRMVFDPLADEFVLFGGNDYSGPNLTFHHLNDTWLFQLTTNRWTQLTPAVSPSTRDYAVEGFDPSLDVVLLFSGYGNRTILDDTWTFSPSNGSWTALDTVTVPPGRYAGVGTFDTVDGLFLIMGGLGNSGLLNDSWTLSLEVVPPSPVPSPASPAGSGWLVAGTLVGAGAVLAVLAARVYLVSREQSGK